MTTARRTLAAWIVLLGASLPCVTARADDVADAEELFRRAKALMAKGKATAACPLFQESYRLDSAQGTLLNLALCNERIGKVGTAWGQFRAVEQQARRAVPPRPDRADLAKEHADKLEPMLSRLRIRVSDDARAPGLVIKVAGEEKREPLWALGVVVDPGATPVEVSAPGKKTVTTEVQVGDHGATAVFTVPKLEDVPTPDAPARAASVAAPPAQGESPDPGARRTAGYVVGGLGLASLAVGTAFGIAAIVNNSSAKECASPCYVGTPDAVRSNEATDRALLFATVADVTLPLGVLGAAVGSYLVLTAGPTRTALAARIGARSASVGLTGRW